MANCRKLSIPSVLPFVKVRSDEKLLKQVMEQAKESVREMGKSIDAVQTVTSENYVVGFKVSVNGGMKGVVESDKGMVCLCRNCFFKGMTNCSAIRSGFTLRQLDVSNNKLTSLPNEIGLLTQFEIFKSNNNRQSMLQKIKVDLSANMLSELPETVTKLSKLKTLELNNMGLTTLPYVLFKMCLQLSTLGFHNTKITVETLRQLE
ncbi:hypothetical protein Bca4012_037287 [Brassica carinata]